MKTIVMLTLLSIISITACSSNNTPKTQYYLLNSPTLAAKVKEIVTPENKQKSTVSVTLFELPEYLTQPSLVLQLSDHQLYYSHFHMWAEPLNLGISQALSQDLNNHESNFNFIIDASINANKKADITLKISAFQATHQSQVILTGSYFINNPSLISRHKTRTNQFNIAVDLVSDGYPHAVEKMRQATQLLAKKITDNLTKVNQ